MIIISLQQHIFTWQLIFPIFDSDPYPLRDLFAICSPYKLRIWQYIRESRKVIIFYLISYFNNKTSNIKARYKQMDKNTTGIHHILLRILLLLRSLLHQSPLCVQKERIASSVLFFIIISLFSVC